LPFLGGPSHTHLRVTLFGLDFRPLCHQGASDKSVVVRLPLCARHLTMAEAPRTLEVEIGEDKVSVPITILRQIGMLNESLPDDGTSAAHAGIAPPNPSLHLTSLFSHGCTRADDDCCGVLHVDATRAPPQLFDICVRFLRLHTEEPMTPIAKVSLYICICVCICVYTIFRPVKPLPIDSAVPTLFERAFTMSPSNQPCLSSANACLPCVLFVFVVFSL
jgi:hypothetical protein